MTLNPLAFPKGVKLVCELCQKPAFVQCTYCRVTYYCSLEHQRADWIGIHEKICQRLISLRAPAQFMPSEEQRQEREKELLNEKLQMIELTSTTGQKLLFEGKHEQAVPAAMQSLRFSIDVYGTACIQLVPCYLILGAASIGMGHLMQADEYLAQAEWTVLKTRDVSPALKSRLHRHLGLLQVAKGDFPEALRQLADDIYYSSVEFGTEHIQTSGGYFHMANVFFRQGKRDVADSLYKQVTGIWHQHLDRIVQFRTRMPIAQRGVGPVVAEDDEEEEEKLDEAQEAEAIQVLNSIYDIREHQTPRQPQDLMSVCHALAMMYYILHDLKKAKEYGRKAVVASENNPDDELSRSIVEFMKVCDRSTIKYPEQN